MSSALAFIEGALARHGRPLDAGRVLLPCSQADLALEAGRSAGTVAYYLSQLADVVSREPGGLVVNMTALSEARSCRDSRSRADEIAALLIDTFGDGAEEAPVQLVDVGGRPPTVRAMASALQLGSSTTQRHLDSLARGGRLRRQGGSLFLWPPGSQPRAGQAGTAAPAAEVSNPTVLIATTLQRVADELGQLAEHLLAGVADAPRTARARLALVPPVSRGFAARGSSFGFDKGEREAPSSLEDRELRAADRGSPGPSTTDRTERLSDRAAIEDAIQPLVTLCEQLRLPVSLNEDGRRWLGLYSAEELRRGAGEIVRQLRGPGPAIGRPLGLLVSKAKRGEDDFFAPPRPAPAPPPLARQDEPLEPDVDAEAAAAVDAMGADELAALDERVRTGTTGLRGRLVERTEKNAAVWAAHRHLAWRQDQRTGARSRGPANEEA